MNKFILCAMDKSKTIEELKKNSTEAASAYYAADDAAYVAAADAAYAAYAAAAAAYAAKAVYAGAYAAAYWINQYFERTGENREDYENKIKEK